MVMRHSLNAWALSDVWRCYSSCRCIPHGGRKLTNLLWRITTSTRWCRITTSTRRCSIAARTRWCTVVSNTAIDLEHRLLSRCDCCSRCGLVLSLTLVLSLALCVLLLLALFPFLSNLLEFCTQVVSHPCVGCEGQDRDQPEQGYDYLLVFFSGRGIAS